MTTDGEELWTAQRGPPRRAGRAARDAVGSDGRDREGQGLGDAAEAANTLAMLVVSVAVTTGSP